MSVKSLEVVTGGGINYAVEAFCSNGWFKLAKLISLKMQDTI